MVCAIVAIVALASSTAHAATGYADSVDAITAQLKDDPILVQQILGSGDAKLVHRRLRAAASKLDTPVYVALVSRPRDVRTDRPSRDLIVRLHARLGDGIFIAATNDDLLQVAAWGTSYSSADLSLARYRAIDRIKELRGNSARHEFSVPAPGFEAEVILDLAARPGLTLDDKQLKTLSKQSLSFPSNEANAEHDEDPPSTGFTTMIGGVSGLLAFLVLFRGISWFGARKDAPRAMIAAPARPPHKSSKPETMSPERIRALAHSELDALTVRMRDQSGTIVDPEALERAQSALQAAGRALSQKNLSADVGALVLSRIGARESERSRGSRAASYVCCFLNPLHGEATSSISLDHGSHLRVPACAYCSDSPAEPDPLIIPRPGPDRPYYRQNDVWSRTGYGSIASDFAESVLREGAS